MTTIELVIALVFTWVCGFTLGMIFCDMLAKRTALIKIQNTDAHSCPSCIATFKVLPHKCNWCGYVFGPLGRGSKDGSDKLTN